MTAAKQVFIYKGKRGLREIDLIKEPKNLLQAVADGGLLGFEVQQITKTQLSVQVFNNEITFSANMKIEGFKLAEKTHYNHFTGKHQTEYYFKLLKSQGKPELEQYLSKVIEQITQKLHFPVKQTEFDVHCRNFSF